jgi:ribosomal protein S18 acetylase RimI-like enzyme
MEKRIVVRRLQLDDITQVSVLLSDAFYSEDGWLGWAAPIFKLGIYQDLKTRTLSQSPHYACLVGFSESESKATIVGTVEISARPLSSWALMGPSVAYVSNLAVAKAFRRQGVGQYLLASCEQIVSSWGYREIYLHVKAENRLARRLYTRVGYQLYRPEVPMWARLLMPPQELLLRKPLK